MTFALPQKSDRIKVMVLIMSALLFVIVGYFRFVYKKPPKIAVQASAGALLGQLQVPRVDIEMLPKVQESEQPAQHSAPGSIRDIFSPLGSTPARTTSRGLHPSTELFSAMHLKGTIVGVGKPLAIINDQFLGPGDWIGGYQVRLISKKEVLLDSGKHRIKLEMAKDE